MALKQGDWLCPNCDFIIWASKPECNKCGALNPNPNAYKQKFRKRTMKCINIMNGSKCDERYSCIHCMKLSKTKRLSKDKVSDTDNTIRLITNIDGKIDIKNGNDGSSKHSNSRKRKHSDLELENDIVNDTINDKKKQRISASVILNLLSSDDDDNINDNTNPIINGNTNDNTKDNANIDWTNLDFQTRNQSINNNKYTNINKNILLMLLNDKLEDQILNDILCSRPNDTEKKLKEFLIEFICHKTETLFKKFNLDKNNNYNNNKNNLIKDYSKFVHLYGSVALQIDSAKCDIDVAIEIPNNNNEKVFLRQLANLLQKHTIKKGEKFQIERIFSAKVPIVKITDPLYNIECDISIYKAHDLSCKYINSLLNYDNDKRIRQLIIAIKHWSKRRKINCAMTGKINSFGFTILVLKYLQTLSNPIIPIINYKQLNITNKEKTKIIKSQLYQNKCKQNKMYKYYTSSNEYHSMNITYNNKNSKNNKNSMSLIELLYGFFEFYSNFNYNKYQISLREKYLQRKQLHNYSKLSFDQLTFIIQDPIEINNNCAKNVRIHTAKLLINEFKRAQLLLLHGGHWINDICADTTMQPNCFDKYTLNQQIMSFQSNKSKQILQYIKQYAIKKVKKKKN